MKIKSFSVFVCNLALSLICFAPLNVFGQKEIFWFEPDFDYSYCLHNVLYRDMVFGEHTSVHYHSFYNAYAGEHKIKEMVRTSFYHEAPMSVCTSEPINWNNTETFRYNKKGYLVAYNVKDRAGDTLSYHVNYSYYSGRRKIIAEYSGWSEYTKVILKFNNQQRLIEKEIYRNDRPVHVYSYAYNDSGFLVRIKDSVSGAHKSSTVAKLIYKYDDVSNSFNHILSNPTSDFSRADKRIKDGQSPAGLGFSLSDSNSKNRSLTILKADGYIYSLLYHNYGTNLSGGNVVLKSSGWSKEHGMYIYYEEANEFGRPMVHAVSPIRLFAQKAKGEYWDVTIAYEKNMRLSDVEKTRLTYIDACYPPNKYTYQYSYYK